MSGVNLVTTPGEQVRHSSSTVNADIVASNRDAIREFLVVGLSCLLFLGISLYQLELPGLYTDEAYDVIPAMQMVLGHPVELQGNVLDLGGLRLPLMSSSAYQGVTYTYLAIPFFAIGGVTVNSLRFMTVLVGALGVLLAYFLGRSWLGREVGCITALLLALSPAWIFWSRLGVYVVSIVAPIGMGALLAFTYWVRNRPMQKSNGPLYLGMFLLGLGLTTKLLFLWFITAVVLTSLLMWGRLLWNRRQTVKITIRVRVRVALLSLLFLCLGAFPFILYNILTGETLNLMRQTLSGPGTNSYGVDNLAIIRNLWTEVDAFKVMLDGGYFWFQGVNQQPYSNPLTPALFALSVFGTLALFLASKRGSPSLPGNSRLFTIAMALLVSALFLTVILALTSVSGSVGTFMMIAALALMISSAAMLTQATLAERVRVADAGWGLLGVMSVAGTMWWFGGAGWPNTRAPLGFLGLWPIDGAGILFWVSASALLIILGSDRNPGRFQRPTVAALAMIGLLVVQSTITVSGLWGTHLLLALPLPQMVIAGFAVGGTRAVGRWISSNKERMWVKWVRVVPASLLLSALLIGDVTVDGLYQRDLAQAGGASTFSDAIYSLNNYLLTDKAGYKVVAMDWGFRRPLQFLSLEKVVPIEGFGLAADPPPEFYTSLRQFLKDKKTVYLFHTEQGTAYPRRDAFLKEVAAEGKEAVADATFSHRDGFPVYELYTVR